MPETMKDRFRVLVQKFSKNKEPDPFKKVPWYMRNLEKAVDRKPQSGPFLDSVSVKLPGNTTINVQTTIQYTNGMQSAVRQVITEERAGVQKMRERSYVKVGKEWVDVEKIDPSPNAKELATSLEHKSNKANIITPETKTYSEALRFAQTREEIKSLVFAIAAEPPGVLRSYLKPTAFSETNVIATELLKNKDFSKEGFQKLLDCVNDARIGERPQEYLVYRTHNVENLSHYLDEQKEQKNVEARSPSLDLNPPQLPTEPNEKIETPPQKQLEAPKERPPEVEGIDM